MGDGNMEEKKLNRLVVLWLSIIAIICIIVSVILEIFAAQKDYFGLLDGLAMGFLVIAFVCAISMIIYQQHWRKSKIQARIDVALQNPTSFFDAIIKDYKEHNLCLDVESDEKITITPIIDYQQQVAIFYHTLLGDKKHLLLLDVYFYQQECVIMFDEGKVYEETIAYDNDNDTKDFYYQISIKINDYLKQYLIDQANSKS